MRDVLLISPHFPPDASAGAHRVRLLAPYLPKYGWQPTVLTCRPDAYEGELDPELSAFVPPSLRVVRTAAWSVRFTRRIGVGDLGLRSFAGLWREACRLCERERFAVVFITIFPGYTALIGPLLARRFGVPYVLDYQDPWVSVWGTDVGGGAAGQVDMKSRLSRRLAEWLEPRAVRAASAITGVSTGTYEPILKRNPAIRPITEAIPLGAEPRDFLHQPHNRPELPFDPDDGMIHVCYTGTVLPLGIETLRALLAAIARLRTGRPDLYARLRVHFIGTSNQHLPTTEPRVLPHARELGVDDVVRERPMRLPYSTIVHVQRQAGVLVALGSSEPHYTASKIFPLLLASRPLLAVYHERSSVNEVLAALPPSSGIACVTYSDTERVGARVDAIYAGLVRVITAAAEAQPAPDLAGVHGFLAEELAGRLASVFDRVVERRAA